MASPEKSESPAKPSALTRYAYWPALKFVSVNEDAVAGASAIFANVPFGNDRRWISNPRTGADGEIQSRFTAPWVIDETARLRGASGMRDPVSASGYKVPWLKL